jgi:hypothetical protein
MLPSGEREESRTQRFRSVPEKSYIEIQENTSTVTKHRKQIFPI